VTGSLAFSPLVDLGVIAALAVLAAVVLVPGLLARRPGAVLRLVAALLVLVALAGPQWQNERRSAPPGVAVLLTDRSASNRLPGRAEASERARAGLAAAIGALPGIELREVAFDDRGDLDADGTRLFDLLGRTLADVPPERVSGVVVVTDGVVHDVPATAAALGFEAPIHALISGRGDEIDRRVELLETPRFGLVGKPLALAFRVVDAPTADARPIGVTVRRDGEVVARTTVRSGERTTLPVEVPHAGDVVFEVEADPLPGDLTPLDDRAVLTVQGIREHLRVLLISGEPHPGERTWRDLLKSDAAVDLVHFTILRPVEKQDATPTDEMALIAFPTRELFQDRIGDFDLIVLDRWQRRSILPSLYLDNIARRVRDGGALLVAAGPDLAGRGSLFSTPLGDVLPAEPTGETIEDAFLPRLSVLGRRHPVTRGLAGGASEPPAWGPWFRLSGVTPSADADVLMTGAGDRPLVVAARRGKGRVALITSDQVWLWARGHQGGGPHAQLLRRLAHWLMREPELEEEALHLGRRGNDLVIERRTLADHAAPVRLTSPDGTERRLDLAETEPGRFTAVVGADRQGLWRATDGTLTALVGIGPPNPREFADLLSTERRLAPIAAATGGSVHRLRPTRGAAAGDGVVLPEVLLRPAGAPMAGSGWIGLARPKATVLEGAERTPIAAGLLAAALLLLVSAAGWWREGR
jgi:uncharacterized membrane protein